MSSKPILLVLGAGKNNGQALIERFLAAGYRVAAVSRSREDSLSNDHLDIKADLGDVSSVPKIFEKVRSTWGHPSIVVYNGYARRIMERNDPLATFSVQEFESDMTSNVTSAIQAAHLAVEGFKILPQSVNKTFIFTGNKLYVMPAPLVPYFGMGKCAMASLMWSLSEGYKDAGFRFYYADERYADGTVKGLAISGTGYADLAMTLATDPEQKYWEQTFVEGQGYVDFREIDGRNIIAGKFDRV